MTYYSLMPKFQRVIRGQKAVQAYNSSRPGHSNAFCRRNSVCAVLLQAPHRIEDADSLGHEPSKTASFNDIPAKTSTKPNIPCPSIRFPRKIRSLPFDAGSMQAASSYLACVSRALIESPIASPELPAMRSRLPEQGCTKIGAADKDSDCYSKRRARNAWLTRRPSQSKRGPYTTSFGFV